MESLHKNIQLMLEFLKAPFKAQGSTFFLLYINDLSDYTIYNITIYADESTQYFRCHQASDLWQQLELASNLNLAYKTLRTETGSGLLISMLEKLNLFCLTGLTSLVQKLMLNIIDVEIDGSVLEEKSSLKILRLSFSSKLDCGSYIISIVKIVSDKIGVLICFMKFFPPEVVLCLFKSTIRP